MNFQSLSFLVFLTLTVIVCLAAGRKNRTAGLFLLTAACALFCLLGNHGLRSLFVILIGCNVTKWASRKMAALQDEKRRRVLRLACAYHILVLTGFKYTGFFTGGAVSINWVPIGLSFFTFQQLWLLKEVYTGEFIPAPKDSMYLYAFFFPTLTSGPILRPSRFFPQLRSENFLKPTWQDLSAGLYAISLGMAKKVLLADPLGTVVANGWAMVGNLTAPAAWIVMLAYTLQLYLDFSGYCDIAAGCARLLGIRLPVNFNSPYRSLSVGEFWKRWHITLTSFLRECLYFPLGGSRKGAGRAYLNILIVFLVSGFWHGAGWTFLVWGGLHGLAQIVERMWGKQRMALPKSVQWILTFLFVNLAWVFFRAPDLASAMELFSAAVSGGWGLPLEALAVGVLDSEVTAIETMLPALEAALPGFVLTGLLVSGLVVSLWPKNTIQAMEEFRPSVGTAAICGALLAYAALSFSSVATFIYSNF